ncbi:hypothetical protein QZH41_015586 [Actinostola sp. cb2023]|nr:hypothetical protein QZH41_015586 [Actinostola sp. cb2023]
MPFGLLDYVIQFFTCTDVRQIREPEDYRSWLETLESEFPSRFHRLFAGPMWSNQDKEDQGDPHKALANVPCGNLVTHWKKSKEHTDFSATTDIQVSALNQLKAKDRRFWIKIDGTDIKTAIMESVKGVWNGDVDLGDGKLQELRKGYDECVADVRKFELSTTEMTANKLQNILNDDVAFLMNGLEKARTTYHEKFLQKVPNQTLKELNWEIVEFNTLLQQNQMLQSRIDDICLEDDEVKYEGTSKSIPHLATELTSYLSDSFRKKRTAASHVLVTMLSDEKRSKKPYALPVRYIPYNSLKDQYIRDFNKDLKEKMVERGLKVIGTVTDGEFCSLRSQGETRPLHLWQLIHDAKEAARKLSKKSLLDMLVQVDVDIYGSSIVNRPNPVIPNQLIQKLHELRTVNGLSLEDAVTNIRGSLVPDGYTPYPFKKDTEESLLDMLRSIVATCIFRDAISYWKARDVNFSLYIYIPEVDPITNDVRHDRSDHNHLFRRAVKSIRDGNDQSLDFESFDEVLLDPGSGLTHAALVGLRKQSLVDAERLASKFVVRSLLAKGYNREAKHVKLLVNWHEASDGRGLTQLQRCKYNYQMLNYLLDEWLPWHRQTYDFSTIDINRPTTNVRGFSRETLVEITTNIESQEYRRRENNIIGYAEHPRAGGTDDLETLFSIAHRRLGNTFTLKDWCNYWPKLVREFAKRMDDTLPFYYWTLNERYRDEELPSFDAMPHNIHVDIQDDDRHHPLRLHRLKLNRREDASIFAPGRAFLPSRNRATIRQRLHRHEVDLPPIPE